MLFVGPTSIVSAILAVFAFAELAAPRPSAARIAASPPAGAPAVPPLPGASVVVGPVVAVVEAVVVAVELVVLGSSSEPQPAVVAASAAVSTSVPSRAAGRRGRGDWWRRGDMPTA
ncbi:hypothetical protein PAI11_42180 [Patulibacter medicamentivorans]|uniref:Uncharacterized protein n=1 Tax=Patulibacter medicamentivorans TaxID=1097667 RepID=H0EBI7_9ACTN|nr:hypothetical protein PAI11_42180 [Patulibacter medicamentivorans]